MKSEYLIELKHKRFKIIALAACLLGILLISLIMGRYFVSLSDIVNVILGKNSNEMINQVLFEVRIPRVLAAGIIGASLSISGAAYQGMFKNPLVS